MILLLIEHFKDSLHLKLPNVFSYYSTRMILAAITSLILVIFLGPYFIRILSALKVAATTRTEDCPLLCQLHKKKRGTPSMGGSLILFSMLISMFLWMDLTHIFTFILFVATIILGALGARDDYLKLKHQTNKGISAKKKLLCQGILSGILALYLLYPPLTDMVSQNSWFNAPIIKEHVQVEDFSEELPQAVPPVFHRQLTLKEYASRLYLPFNQGPLVQFSGVFVILAGLFIMFVVTGSSNAVNLTDGLDGLAAGCLIMVASCLALFAFVANNVDIAAYLNILYVEGSGEIAIYLCGFVGACIGFLWYNGYPAQLFMGDTGSLALGGIIGVSAVLLKKELLLGLIGGVFVVEALSVILQVFSYKFRNKKRIFLCAPLHHHFECKGWPETKVVIRFWIIGLLLAFFGIASLKFQ